ncbi:hypothetical protein FB192DRAFT_1449593 [Mucor lusitanicus]|uniref:ubiquitinyl hydrolase 1 n=2 Tax=Mucor circinelloides f. lusitanicus TaxID=29924 RepID=A0A8H4BDM2_MUCCL|nr:hypothetical protein FB192DRAFT_1449593 [Mucor lusitanicus]
MPTFCFGDISRDEINTVLNIAGVSLAPPTKTPFVTGIQRKRPVVINTPIISQQQKTESTLSTLTEQKQPKKSDPVVEKPAIVEEKKDAAPSAPAKSQQQQQKPSSAKKEAKQQTPATTNTTASSAVNAAQTTPSTTTTAAAAATAPVTAASQTAVEPPSPQPKVKPAGSWASLLKKPDTAKKAATANGPSANGVAVNGKASATRPNKPASPTPTTVPKFTGVADIISKYEPTYTAPLLQPRGLINNVNTCFMNVILQPLSHCAPFYNLIKTISNQVAHTIKSKTPLLDSIIEFINEFPCERLDHMEKYGEPFVPEYVYNALREQKKFDTLRGRQEDSEEFLCFLLDGLHEEMTAVLKEQQDKKEAEAAAAAKAAGGDDWLEVGAKNKTSNLRSTGFQESPISKIFGGKVRSVLRCPGAKDSINLEPYQSLPLDIQPDNVHSIEDAIANMTLPETMHDYTSPKGIKVDATKQVYLEGLPPVLILHMKRFVFDNVGGVQKLSKRVNYGAKLTIDPEWMVPASRPTEPITYQLFGCVYHHGTSAGGGHYTCDIKRRNNEWLHIDDTTITSVSEQDVLVTEDNTRTSEKIHAGQTAYILFYVRSS